jgi:hypothetical protein
MIYFKRWRIWVVRRKIKQNTAVSVEWVALLLLIKEVLESKLCPETGYLGWSLW